MSSNSFWGITWTAAWQTGQGTRRVLLYLNSVGGSDGVTRFQLTAAQFPQREAGCGLSLPTEPLPSQSCPQPAPQPPARPPALSPALCKQRCFQLPSWSEQGCPRYAPLLRGLRNVVPDVPYCGCSEQKGTGSSKGNETDYSQECSRHQRLNSGVPQETCWKHTFFLTEIQNTERCLPATGQVLTHHNKMGTNYRKRLCSNRSSRLRKSSYSDSDPAKQK